VTINTQENRYVILLRLAVLSITPTVEKSRATAISILGSMLSTFMHVNL
jgi:hypothetical protein